MAKNNNKNKSNKKQSTGNTKGIPVVSLTPDTPKNPDLEDNVCAADHNIHNETDRDRTSDTNHQETQHSSDNSNSQPEKPKKSFFGSLGAIFMPRKKYKKEIGNLQSQLDELQQQLNEKSDHITSLEQTIHEKERAYRSISEDMGQLHLKIKDLDIQKTNLKKEREEKEVTIRNKDNEIDRITKEKGEKIREIQELKEALRKQNPSDTSAEISGLKQDLRDKDKDIFSLNKKLTDLEAEKTAAENARDNAKAEHEKAIAELNSLHSELNAIKADTTAQDTIKALQKELEEIKEANPDTAALVERVKDYDRLSQANASLQEKLDEKENAFKDLEETSSQVSANLDKANRKLEEAEARYNKELEEAKMEAAEKVKEAKDKATKEIQLTRSNAEKELQEAKNKAKEELENEKRLAADRLNEAKAQADEALKKAIDDADQKLLETITLHENTLAEIQQKANDEKERLFKEHADKIESLKASHHAEIESLKTTHAGELKNCLDRVDIESIRADQLFDAYCAMLRRTYHAIEANLNSAAQLAVTDSAPARIINNTILNNDLISLTEFTSDYFIPAIEDIPEKSAPNLHERLLKRYTELLKIASPTWVDALLRLDALLRVPFIAGQFAAAGIDALAIQTAAANIKLLLADCGITMEVPALFSDTFDSARHSAEPIKNIHTDVSDVASHVANPETIIDLYTAGYHSDDQKLNRRPAVSRLNA